MSFKKFFIESKSEQLDEKGPNINSLIKKAQKKADVDFKKDPNAKPITKKQLNDLEKQLDKLFAAVGIDVEFTKHFFDRLNDPRNKKQITVKELSKIFNDTYKKYGNKLSNSSNLKAVLNDISTHINIPVKIQINFKTGLLDMVGLTIMRRREFLSPDSKLKV